MKCCKLIVMGAVIIACLIPMYWAAEDDGDNADEEEDIDRTIEKLSEVMKSLLNRAGSEKRKLSGLVTSMKSLDGALYDLECDAHTLNQQNVELLNKFNTCESIPAASIGRLEEIKECITEVQDTLDDIEAIVHPCGGSGWIEVVNVSYADPSVPCPAAWEAKTMNTSESNITRRGCGTSDITQDTPEAVIFDVNGEEYDEVCGRIHGYAFSNLGAFTTFDFGTRYVGGVSVTHDTPLTHIWTFAAAAQELETLVGDQCPCEGGQEPPLEVGQNYFCESGANGLTLPEVMNTFHGDDLLWDGEDCVKEVCCTRQTPPYFNSYLAMPTTENITVTLFLAAERDILITYVELHVRKVD